MLAASEGGGCLQAVLTALSKRHRMVFALFCTLIVLSIVVLAYHQSADVIWSLGQSTPFRFDSFNSGSTRLNYSKVATILEPRMSATLIPLLVSYLAIVPADWPFVVWCSSENYLPLLASNSLSSAIDSGRLNLTILPDDIDLHNGEYLSRFLTKPWFYHQFHRDAEWMFFFQSDATLCAASDQSLEDWLGYDWVGSPTLWTPNNGHGGNGGLGIRRVSTMQRITANTTLTRADWHGETEADGVLHENAEDYWFMTAIDALLGDEAKWPERDGRDQNEFSIVRSDEYMRPLGVHKGHGEAGLFQGSAKESGEHAIQRLLSYCPEFALIMDDEHGRFND